MTEKNKIRALLTLGGEQRGSEEVPPRALPLLQGQALCLWVLPERGSDWLTAGGRHPYCRNCLIVLVIISPQVIFIW